MKWVRKQWLTGLSHWEYFVFCAPIGFALGYNWQWFAQLGAFARPTTQQEASEIVRNYGLVFGGIAASILAIIRLNYIDRQHALEKRSALFDRFQRSSAMLGDPNIAIRQAGIFSLTEIAIEEPEEFYIQVQGLICGFLRQASAMKREESEDIMPEGDVVSALQPEWPEPPADMVDALNAFNKLRSNVLQSESLEDKAKFKPNLSRLFVPGFDIDGVDFRNCDLANAVFSDTYQENVRYRDCKLSGSIFDRAEMNFCWFNNVQIENWRARWAEFHGGDICDSHVHFLSYEGSLANGFVIVNSRMTTGNRDEFDHAIDAGFPVYDNTENFKLARDTARTIALGNP